MKKFDTIPILETAILEMGRLKGEESFSALEVIQWIFPQSWAHFIPEVMDEMRRLHEENKVSEFQNDGLDPKEFLPQTLFKIVR